LEYVIAALRRAVGDTPAGAWRVEAMPRAGEALEVARVHFDGPPPRTWVAKRLHPRLLRERAAYTGPLSGTGIAPRLEMQVEASDASLWLVFEDAGLALSPSALSASAEEAAALAARVHTIPWRPAPRPPWPRPVHVAHGRRHLAGEWRIALDRAAAGVVGGVIEADLLPSPAEAHAVFERASSAMGARGESFVHGDLQAANLVRGADGALRVIDWSQWGYGPTLLDVAGLTADMDERARERFLDAYLDARGSAAETGAATGLARTGPGELQLWREALAQAIPYRIFIGLAVLAEYALRGVRTDAVCERLPERVAAWRAAREEAAAWK
jgi:aminoglycoside phosphotransferase (APT) family kinase protein